MKINIQLIFLPFTGILNISCTNFVSLAVSLETWTCRDTRSYPSLNENGQDPSGSEIVSLLKYIAIGSWTFFSKKILKNVDRKSYPCFDRPDFSLNKVERFLHGNRIPLIGFLNITCTEIVSLACMGCWAIKLCLYLKNQNNNIIFLGRLTREPFRHWNYFSTRFQWRPSKWNETEIRVSAKIDIFVVILIPKLFEFLGVAKISSSFVARILPIQPEILVKF